MMYEGALTVAYIPSNDIMTVVFPTQEHFSTIKTMFNLTILNEMSLRASPEANVSVQLTQVGPDIWHEHMCRPLVLSPDVQERLDRKEHFSWPTMSHVDIWARVAH
jgi:hypothetical protein